MITIYNEYSIFSRKAILAQLKEDLKEENQKRNQPNRFQTICYRCKRPFYKRVGSEKNRFVNVALNLDLRFCSKKCKQTYMEI